MRWLDSFVTEDEKEIFDAEYPAVVPFLMEEYGNECRFEVYSGFERSARRFAGEFPEERFSEEALGKICAYSDEYLAERGYSRDKKQTASFYIRYEFTGSGRLLSLCLSDTTFFLSDIYAPGQSLFVKKGGNITTFNLPSLVKKGIPAFVTLCGDRIVSIATVNETEEEKNILEITVETAPAFRKRGYAVSNTAALADYIQKLGKKAVYCCRATNLSSRKVAEHCGFEKSGRFFAVSAYRD